MVRKEETRTNAELIAAINRGEWSAFDGLYFRHRDWVLRLAWRFTADHELSLDVLQETFTYLARKFPGFELRASFTTFLYPVVKHAALAMKRKRREVVTDAIQEGTQFAAQISELENLVGRLGEAHREVVLMRFVDDMSLEEIAAALQIPIGTVKSRLHHAIAELREDVRVQKYFGMEEKT